MLINSSIWTYHCVAKCNHLDGKCGAKLFRKFAARQIWGPKEKSCNDFSTIGSTALGCSMQFESKLLIIIKQFKMKVALYFGPLGHQ